MKRMAFEENAWRDGKTSSCCIENVLKKMARESPNAFFREHLTIFTDKSRYIRRIELKCQERRMETRKDVINIINALEQKHLKKLKCCLDIYRNRKRFLIRDIYVDYLLSLYNKPI